MSTWTFRRSVLCLCLGLVSGGCQKGGLFGAKADRAFDNPRRDVALSGAELADGAVTLAPPVGYCVDKRSLSPSFAVMARCDSLGARRRVPDAPLGMILVSVAAPQVETPDLDTALAAIAPNGAEVIETRVADPLALVHLRGPTPDGADARHWRGLAQIGPHLLGLTAYAPTGGELSGDAGRRVLEQLVQRTRDATAARPQVAEMPEAGPGKRDRPGGILAGLFDRKPFRQ